jgi:predicted DNA-binding transcriptional regulator AlpA
MSRLAQVEPLAAKIGTVARTLDSSTATVRRRMKDDPEFPRPFRLVPNGELFWWMADVRAYLERKASQAIAA